MISTTSSGEETNLPTNCSKQRKRDLSVRKNKFSLLLAKVNFLCDMTKHWRFQSRRSSSLTAVSKERKHAFSERKYKFSLLLAARKKTSFETWRNVDYRYRQQWEKCFIEQQTWHQFNYHSAVLKIICTICSVTY